MLALRGDSEVDRMSKLLMIVHDEVILEMDSSHRRNLPLFNRVKSILEAPGKKHRHPYPYLR